MGQDAGQKDVVTQGMTQNPVTDGRGFNVAHLATFANVEFIVRIWAIRAGVELIYKVEAVLEKVTLKVLDGRFPDTALLAMIKGLDHCSNIGHNRLHCRGSFGLFWPAYTGSFSAHNMLP